MKRISKEEMEKLIKESAERSAVRAKQVDARVKAIQRDPWLKKAFHFSTLVIVEANRLKSPRAETLQQMTMEEEARLWGFWQRDMKKAVDLAGPIARVPFPKVPSWFPWNQRRLEFALEIGVKDGLPTDRKSVPKRA